MKKAIEHESLKEEMRRLIEEARMLLPGLQALFGFQTIAVFNGRFSDLPVYAQRLHLAALAAVVFAVALVMTPAALHRIAQPGMVSRRLVSWSSALICTALLPLACGLSMDLFVVAVLATDSPLFSAGLALVTLILALVLWFLVPFVLRARDRKLT